MEPTPGAALIEQRRKELQISARDAARAAGMSDGRWRQIAKGYQQVTADVRAPVAAPPATLARMARVVGVSADELERAGEAPAARALREMASDASPGPLASASDDELIAELRRRLARSRGELVDHESAPIVTTGPESVEPPGEAPSVPGGAVRARSRKGRASRPAPAPAPSRGERRTDTNHGGT